MHVMTYPSMALEPRLNLLSTQIREAGKQPVVLALFTPGLEPLYAALAQQLVLLRALGLFWTIPDEESWLLGRRSRNRLFQRCPNVLEQFPAELRHVGCASSQSNTRRSTISVVSLAVRASSGRRSGCGKLLRSSITRPA